MEAGKKSSDFEYGTKEYYHLRVMELENERDTKGREVDYYRTELSKAHELLGRVLHQTSERWDSVNLTKYFPTDNLHRTKNSQNPTGKDKK